MVFADTGYFNDQVYGESLVYREDKVSEPHFSEWQRVQSMVPKQVSHLGYNFQLSQTAITGSSMVPASSNNSGPEVYQHIGATDQTADTLQQFINQHSQSWALASEKIYAEGSYIGLYAGNQFSLDDHTYNSELGNFYVYALSIDANDHSQRWSVQAHDGHAIEQSFSITLLAYPAQNRFVPLARYTDFPADKTLTPMLSDFNDPELKQIAIQKPIAGLTQARVTGPEGQVLYADNYGRVKIQFMFDRYGKWDENSSNWVRINQMWAGNGYGAQFIPRINDEVAVDFENGDPDKPIVVGAIYNANNLPPFNTQSQSGFKTQTLGSTDPADGHVLRFDDTAGSEELYLKTQKDLNVNVKGHSTKVVAGNSTTQIGQGNYVQLVNGILKIQAKNEIRIACGTSAIVVNAGGVTLQGDNVTIEQAPAPSSALSSPSVASSVPDIISKQLGGSSQPQTTPSSPIQQFETIVTVKAQPKWRKLVPDNSKVTDFSSLLRLPDSVRQAIIHSIMNRYTPATVDAAKNDPVPTDFSDWSNLVTLSDKDTLVQQATEALQVENAQDLREGWIYVLGQANGGPDDSFAQMHLFKEYQVSGSTFKEVDLSTQAGSDQRRANGPISSTIELPYAYMENNNIKGKFQVQVFFSGTQLSWPRVNLLGGMAKDDPRLDTITNAAQLKLISDVQSISPDAKLRQTRAGQIITPSLLDTCWQVQQNQQPAKPVASSGTEPQSTWQSECLYYTSNNTNYPTLLLDDPVGMAMEGNHLQVNLINQLRYVMSAMQTKTDQNGQCFYQAAVLAQQLFMKYDYPGIIKDQGYYKSINDNSGEMLPWARAQSYIDADKLNWYINYTERETLHGLVKQTQIITVSILLDGWSTSSNSKQAPQLNGQWAVDINEAIKDNFAQPKESFVGGYAFVQGLYGLSCYDSRVVDAKLTVNNQYIDTHSSFGSTQDVIHYQKVKRYTILQTEVDTMFYQDGQVKQAAMEPKLIVLDQPAGFDYVGALHTEGFPLFNSLFPSDSNDPQAYIKAQGEFNATAFAWAWNNNSTTPVIGLENANRGLLALLSGYVEQVSEYRDKRVETVTDIIKTSKKARALYGKLVKQGAGDNIDAIVESFRERAKKSPTIQRLLSKNPDAFKPTAAMDSDDVFKTLKNANNYGCSLLTICYALWGIKEDIMQATEQSADAKSNWLIMAQFACTLTQIGSNINDFKEAMSNLVGQEKVNAWIEKFSFNQACKSFSGYLGVEFNALDLLSYWGIAANLYNLAGSVISLINILSGKGISDPALIISSLFNVAGNSFYVAASVKQGMSALASAENSIGSSMTAQGMQSEGLIADSTVADTGFEFAEFMTSPAGLVLAGTACIVISNLVLVFQHNQFQIWAENSPFTNSGNVYDGWANNPAACYNALMALILVPTFKVDDNASYQGSSARYIAVSASIPSMYGLLAGDKASSLIIQPDWQAGIILQPQSWMEPSAPANQYFDFMNVQVAHSSTVHYPNEDSPAEIGLTQYYDYNTVMNMAKAVANAVKPQFAQNTVLGTANIQITPKAQLQIADNESFPPSSVDFPSEGKMESVADWLSGLIGDNSDESSVKETVKWWQANNPTEINVS
jgi:type VI secretion system VgrG family protein